ncbi:MAG: capsule assembly Wzi family protein [Leptothrix sp. (in: b-proteobacteria)]
MRQLLVWGALACGAHGAAHAQASLPYTPSVAARHAIEYLSDEVGLGLPVMQWPLPAAAMQSAIDALPAGLSAAQAQARDLVAAELRRRAGAELALRVGNRRGSLVGFGDAAVPGSSLALRSTALQVGDGVAMQLGARVDAAPVLGAVPAGTVATSGVQVRLDDAAVVAQIWGVNLQAWSRRSWWGPGWQDSLVLGNNAPALGGFGFQRAAAGASESPWLSWLGPWNFEFFMAEQEGHANPANAWLIGNRLTLRPWQGVEIGLTRTAQWGGGGRPQSASSFVNMLTGTGTNADTTSQQASDPGNQMAGFDLRLRCPQGLRCVGYTQLIGEDMAGYLPSEYLSLYGLESWAADGSARYVIEYLDSSCNGTHGSARQLGCAYRNYLYPQGYASQRRWLGAGTGPDARVVTLGWFGADSATSLRLHAGLLDGVNQTSSELGAVAPYVPGAVARLYAAQWQRELPLAGGVLTPQLGWQRLSGRDWASNSVSFGANWRISLDAKRGGAAASAGWQPSGWADREPWLAAAAVMAAGLALDRPADDYARQHGNDGALRVMRHAGNAVPVAAMALAGTDWLLHRDSTEANPARAAVLAGFAAYGSNRLIKAAVQRDRPTEELGPNSFGQGANRSDSSFPSNHVAVAWALLTPYAKATGSDVPYYLAALVNLSRVAGRDHWASDTAASTLLGYGLGSYAWSRSQADPRAATLHLLPRGLAVSVPLQ